MCARSMYTMHWALAITLPTMVAATRAPGRKKQDPLPLERRRRRKGEGLREGAGYTYPLDAVLARHAVEPILTSWPLGARHALSSLGAHRARGALRPGGSVLRTPRGSGISTVSELKEGRESE